MIKGNESDVGNIHFELHAKTIDKFLCFTLFLNLKNCSYLCNQMSDCDDVWVIMKLFKWTNNLYCKIKIEYADMWLISFDRVKYWFQILSYWGLDQNVAFEIGKWFILKNQIWILPTYDSFPLIVSQICDSAHWKRGLCKWGLCGCDLSQI